jgi:anti-sigma regulatory factor (Ser/Thr protein kinase)
VDVSDLRVSLRNEVNELERLAALVESFAADQDLPDESALNLTLALDEVITNIIAYAYPAGGEHAIEVCVTRHGDRLVGVIEDDGVAFNPLVDTATPDIDAPIDARGIGGLGLFLVRQVMSDVTYSRDGSRNRLTLTMRVPD